MDILLLAVGLILLLLSSYCAIRGFAQIFERHNAILVVCYFVFLFPWAFWHAVILGIFGRSKKSRIERAAKEQASFQVEVEKEMERLSKG